MSRRRPIVAAVASVSCLIMVLAGCGNSTAAGAASSGSSPAGSSSPAASSSSAAASAPASSGASPSAGSTSGSSAAGGTSAPAAAGSVGSASKLLAAAGVKPGATLTLANDPTDAPFDSQAPGGGFAGVDYDIAQALAADLGVTIKFQQLGFDGIIPALQSGRFDMSMSAMSDLKKRQSTVTFVDYFLSGYAIVVPKGNPENIHSLTDLCGKAAAAQKGDQEVTILQQQSTDCVSAGKKGIDLKIYPIYSETQLQLEQGRVAAILQGIGGAAYAAKNTGGKLEMVPTAQLISPSPYGIAFPKDSKLPPVFQAALQDIIDNGVYGKILAKWNLSSGAVKKATINAATS